MEEIQKKSFFFAVFTVKLWCLFIYNIEILNRQKRRGINVNKF